MDERKQIELTVTTALLMAQIVHEGITEAGLADRKRVAHEFHKLATAVIAAVIDEVPE